MIKIQIVLILVVMDHALTDANHKLSQRTRNVLILVVMDHALTAQLMWFP